MVTVSQFNTTTSSYCQAPLPSIGVSNFLVNTLVQTLLISQCNISNSDIWPVDYAETVLNDPSTLNDFDFIVIGAGSAGSVVASRLSENPEWKVLLLEAGGNPPEESEIPGLFLTLEHTDFVWNYWTEPTQPKAVTNLAQRNETCYWPRGKLLGGSGGVNAMYYIRGNRRDYDTWLQRGNIGWGWSDVKAYFEKSLSPQNTTDPRGYLVVSGSKAPKTPIDTKVRNMMFSGAKQLGVPRVATFDENHSIGYSDIPLTLKDGLRTSSAKTYLGGELTKRPNLHVIKFAKATRINFDASGTEVVSINFTLRDKYELTVTPKKELVLSAGSIDSAKLLLLSGVGPRDDLENIAGISPKNDLPVGQNLQDHLSVSVFYKIPPTVSEKDIDMKKTALNETYEYFINRSGPLAGQNFYILGGFVNTVDGSTSPYPDIQYHHQFIPCNDNRTLITWAEAFELKDEYKQYLVKEIQSYHLILINVILLQPKSLGQIKLRSANHKDAPLIYPNYLQEPDDLKTLLRGFRYLVRLEKTIAFTSEHAEILHIPIEECDRQFKYKTVAYWRCYVKYFSGTLYHPTGTVRMGPRVTNTSCVDERLRLHNVKNMRVIDASIMPNIISGNTNAATVMIGEKGADLIREDWLGLQEHSMGETDESV